MRWWTRTLTPSAACQSPCSLCPLKGKIPVRDAVQLAQDTRSTILVRRGLRLLGRGKLPIIRQHVDARKLEGAVGTHGFPECAGLGLKGLLRHHVPGQHDSVILAPGADLVGECLGKPFREMVVIPVPLHGNLAVRQFPEKLRKMVHDFGSIGCTVGIRKVIREGNHDIADLVGEPEGFLVAELRFVREDGGNGCAEFRADRLQILLMGFLDEPSDGGGIQRVRVCLAVVPGIVLLHAEVGMPAARPRGGQSETLVFRPAAAISVKMAIPEVNGVGCQPIAFQRRAGRQGLFIGFTIRSHPVHRIIRRQQQETRAVAVILRHAAPGGARRPAVLVIQPGKHAVLPRLFIAGPDHREKFLSHVRRGETDAAMHVKSAHAHVAHHVDLPGQRFLVKLVVPGPERCSAIFGGRVPEQFPGKGRIPVFRIQHGFSSCNG